MTESQLIFLKALSSLKGWATWRDNSTWDLGNQRISVTRAEVEELEKLGYVGGPAAFDPSVIISDWWYSRLTQKGLDFLKEGA